MEDVLQSIPEEILRKILLFADIPSLMCLADTNTSYQNFVYTDCPFLWKDIDFGKISQQKTRNISDASLAALLTAVNAREVTTCLSLQGCTAIHGAGLEPLRGSQCLEQIDLQRTREESTTFGETGLDDGLVIDILSSMAPLSVAEGTNASGLKLVKFRKQHENDSFYDSFSEDIGLFYVRLHTAIANQVEANGVSCSRCSKALVDCFGQEDFLFMAHTTYCSQCKNRTCLLCNPCLKCKVCMEQKCESCGDLYLCFHCGKTHCLSCKPTCFCTKCNKFYCDDCKTTVMCNICYKMCCSDCWMEDFMFCEGCNVFYCSECRLCGFCKGCNKFKCLECGRFVFYDKDTLLCQECDMTGSFDEMGI